MMPLDVDIAGALSRLSQPRSGAFALTTRTLQAKRGFDRQNARQRAIRAKYVRPENADKLAELLPTDAGDVLHAIVPGDFIFCDLLTTICRTRKPARLDIATLSMSKANVDSLTAELRASRSPPSQTRRSTPSTGNGWMNFSDEEEANQFRAGRAA